MGAAMAERINHKLMRCECRSFWQRQLSVASCQLPSCQLSPVCHVFAQFASLRFGSLWFFWPLCAFSADQTNFAHFGMPRMQMPFLSPNYTIHHISFDSTSRSQTVKESKRETFPLTLSLLLSLTPSMLFRSHCECVSNSPFWPNW